MTGPYIENTAEQSELEKGSMTGPYIENEPELEKGQMTGPYIETKKEEEIEDIEEKQKPK